MTDGILRFCTHLGKGKTISFNGSKDGVVSEASIADSLLEYFALDDAFEEHFLAILNKSNDCAKASLACLSLF